MPMVDYGFVVNISRNGYKKECTPLFSLKTNYFCNNDNNVIDFSLIFSVFSNVFVKTA